MTDLKQMMDSVPLNDCITEISQQIDSIKDHANKMKKAVLLLETTKQATTLLKEIDGNIFLMELQLELPKIIDEANNLQSKHNTTEKELKQCKELLKEFPKIKKDGEQLVNQIETALKELSELISNSGKERAQKAIDEINKERNENTNP